MNQTSSTSLQNHQTSDPNTYFPLTILAVSRDEYYGQDTNHQPLQLTIKDGKTNQETQLPKELQGHVFILSPVGSVASELIEPNCPDQIVWSSKDGWTPLYNGDGMIYKLSFNNGGATLKTRLAKPPCYYADQATANPHKNYQELAFRDLGISRISFGILGVRNQVNTAFLPFKTPKDKNERLLVTWDVGRPHEIDPETLETLQPVGKSADWKVMLPTVNIPFQQPAPTPPFKQLMTSAHPCFDPDPDKNAVYTINVGKSLWTMFGLYRSIQARIKDNAESIKKIGKNSNALIVQVLKSYGGLLHSLKCLIKVTGFFLNIYQKFAKNNFVHLMRWDGQQVDIEQQWNILLPGKKPLVIDQTTHQMGLTEKYLVICESSFKFSLENTFPYQRSPIANSFKIWLADFLDYPQFPNTKVYIIKRDDLENAAKKAKEKDPELPTVIAKELTIAPEFSYYLVDYKNPNDLIILHASHLAASDIAECIRSFDRSYYDNRDDDSKSDLYDDEILTSRVQTLSGNVVGPMDASRLGCWIIDPEKAKDIASDQVCFSENNPDFPLTWSTAFYAYRDEQPTQNFTDIYWNSWGAWPDLLTTRAAQQYKDYPEQQRKVSVVDVVQRTYEGIPSSLCHLTIDANSDKDNPHVKLKIIDEYQFKDNKNSQKNVLGTSAQFVPRPKPENPPEGYNPQTDGYIVCVVLTSDKFFSDSNTGYNWSQTSELWIFDAANLQEGPLYKLSHPKMNFGFTVHTTWLKETASPTKIDYDIKKDYEYLVQDLIDNQTPESGLREKIRKLFDDEVYPNFS